MRIVYCIAATHNAGGMERVLANKANYLVNHGYEIHIVTTDQQNKPAYFALDTRIQQHDLAVHYGENANRGFVRKVISYGIKQRRHKAALRDLLGKLKPDITISMFDHEVSFLWSLPDTSKKIVEIHFSRYKRLQYGRQGIWRLVDRFRSDQDKIWAARYARFVVLTEEDKGYWGDMPNIEVIPNANSFHPEKSTDLTRKRAIAVGRYDYQKGFDELIHIWALIADANPDWSLHIFGRGPLKESLQTLIEQLGLQQTIFLQEPVIAIEQEYSKSSVLVMTSRYEGLPMALLEGQACGLPLVAYACKCGPRDIIKDGLNGYLVAEGDRQAMARALTNIMNDGVLRTSMSMQSRRLAVNFSEDNVMKKWVNLFSQLHDKPI